MICRNIPFESIIQLCSNKWIVRLTWQLIWITLERIANCHKYSCIAYAIAVNCNGKINRWLKRISYEEGMAEVWRGWRLPSFWQIFLHQFSFKIFIAFCLCRRCTQNQFQFALISLILHTHIHTYILYISAVNMYVCIWSNWHIFRTWPRPFSTTGFNASISAHLLLISRVKQFAPQTWLTKPLKPLTRPKHFEEFPAFVR